MLFDYRMFPDFAFEVVSAEPEGIITDSTRILVENPKSVVKIEIVKDVRIDDVVGQDEAKKKVRVALLKKFIRDEGCRVERGGK